MKKQAVILAAGESTRTIPLTLTRPKPLLPVAGKTLIEHNLESLEKVGVEEVTVVYGYRGEMLQSYLDGLPLSLTLHWVEQKEALGTAHALAQAAQVENLTDFFLLMGDDLYFAEDLHRLGQCEEGISGYRVPDARRFGVLEVEEGRLKGIIEKPPHIREGLVNTGAYGFTRDIFDYLHVKVSERGEREITDSLTALAGDKTVQVVECKNWHPVTYAWSLLEANAILLNNLEGKIEGKVEEGAHLRGEIYVGEGTIIKSGAYLEGPIWIGKNCTIGPNCHLRGPTHIGHNCKVGNGCEVKASIFFDGVKMGHLSYMGDSVLGAGVNVGAGCLVANLKHDGQNVFTRLKGKVIDTGRRKFGTAIGDGACLGIGTKIYPGRKIWPKETTMPGEIVKKDKGLDKVR